MASDRGFIAAVVGVSNLRSSSDRGVLPHWMAEQFIFLLVSRPRTTWGIILLVVVLMLRPQGLFTRASAGECDEANSRHYFANSRGYQFSSGGSTVLTLLTLAITFVLPPVADSQLASGAAISDRCSRVSWLMAGAGKSPWATRLHGCGRLRDGHLGSSSRLFADYFYFRPGNGGRCLQRIDHRKYLRPACVSVLSRMTLAFRQR